MSKIVFRGKTYNSVFEMPNDIREAYQIEKRRHPESNAAKPLTDFVEMSDEIRELYERAVGNVDDRTASSQPLSELPKTEDIYRQSKPLAPPSYPAIEDDNGSRRLALTLATLLLLAGIAFFVLQYMN